MKTPIPIPDSKMVALRGLAISPPFLALVGILSEYSADLDTLAITGQGPHVEYYRGRASMMRDILDTVNKAILNKENNYG